MQLKDFVLNTLFLVLFAGVSLFAKEEKFSAEGIWLTTEKDAKVEIFRKADKLYGKIVWLKQPLNKAGTPKTDVNNPDETKRTVKIIGMEFLKDFEYDEDFEWEDGSIYDAKSGKTYSCEMYMSEDGKELKVKGYIGMAMFGKTVVWTRSSLD